MLPSLSLSLDKIIPFLPLGLFSDEQLSNLYNIASPFSLIPQMEITIEAPLDQLGSKIDFTVALGRRGFDKNARDAYATMIEGVNDSRWRKSLKRFMAAWARPLSPVNSLVKKVFIVYSTAPHLKDPGLAFDIKNPLCNMTVCRLENDQVPGDILPKLYGGRLPEELMAAVESGFEAVPSTGRVKIAGYLPSRDPEKFVLVTEMDYEELGGYLASLNIPSTSKIKKEVGDILSGYRGQVSVHADFGISMGEKIGVEINILNDKTDFSRGAELAAVFHELNGSGLLTPKMRDKVNSWPGRSSLSGSPLVSGLSVVRYISALKLNFGADEQPSLSVLWGARITE